MNVYNLDELFSELLTIIFHVEKTCLHAVESIKRQSNHFGLNETLQQAATLSGQHLIRLESLFTVLNKERPGSRSEAKNIVGKRLLSEWQDLCKRCKTPSVYNSCLIAGFQSVLHYKICAYGTLVAFAKELGYESAAHHLLDSLLDDKKLDQKLSEIAISEINHEAV